MKRRADAFARRLRRLGLPARVEVQLCQSQIGGGSCPWSGSTATRWPSIRRRSPCRNWRKGCAGWTFHHPPHSHDTILLDMRTVPEEDAALAARELKEGEVLEP